jgi:hypothetical protein
MLISKMAMGYIFINPMGYTYALAHGVRHNNKQAHKAVLLDR